MKSKMWVEKGIYIWLEWDVLGDGCTVASWHTWGHRADHREYGDVLKNKR